MIQVKRESKVSEAFAERQVSLERKEVWEVGEQRVRVEIVDLPEHPVQEVQQGGLELRVLLEVPAM